MPEAAGETFDDPPDSGLVFITPNIVPAIKPTTSVTADSQTAVWRRTVAGFPPGSLTVFFFC
ncbi:MAG: hypothetical protein U5J82_01335 [Desulfobacterales bacterium]|nr:hypothetical protein [Desulfobacterales bacterium]